MFTFLAVVEFKPRKIDFCICWHRSTMDSWSSRKSAACTCLRAPQPNVTVFCIRAQLQANPATCALKARTICVFRCCQAARQNGMPSTRTRPSETQDSFRCKSSQGYTHCKLNESVRCQGHFQGTGVWSMCIFSSAARIATLRGKQLL